MYALVLLFQDPASQESTLPSTKCALVDESCERDWVGSRLCSGGADESALEGQQGAQARVPIYSEPSGD